MSVHNSDNGDDYVEDIVTLISKLDISDPLHLHPNDSTAFTVVSIKLKGTENYEVWSNTDEVLGRQWDRVNAVVLGWILNSISEELFWQNGSSIADYYHNLNALWKQFDAMIELPKYVCNAFESFKKHNQLMKLMQFLMGLDDSYMQIRSSILSTEVFPDVRSAYATISSKESHRVASDGIGSKGKNVSNNNSVRSSSSSGFTDEQMATLISLIKDNKIGKNVQANMTEANQHMTHTDKELDNVLDISHLKLKLVIPMGMKLLFLRLEISDYIMVTKGDGNDGVEVLAGSEYRWEVERMIMSSVDSHRVGQEAI
ncbi:hypothetical protein Tco_0663282 [Tanacetum coccineum]